jgi:hypothetical protein
VGLDDCRIDPLELARKKKRIRAVLLARGFTRQTIQRSSLDNPLMSEDARKVMCNEALRECRHECTSKLSYYAYSTFSRDLKRKRELKARAA